ncbi:MAG: hypothetical protein JWO11_3206 [Nocardioides sp.]|nr:hypothetical protein [Nocardioides sp.]
MRRACVKRPEFIVAVITCVPLLVTACDAGPNRALEATPAVSQAPSEVSPSSSATTSKAPVPTKLPMPCDPGAGFPVHKDGCPDPEPDTGWLTAADGRMSLTPFQTLRNDAEGEAYARDHGEEYPFSDDYFDASNGTSHPLEITRGTVCTGVIRVGYREPLQDHVVDCDELAKVAERGRVPLAVWLSGSEVVQASELYRP